MLSRVVQGAHQTIDRLAGTAAPHVQRLQEGVATRAEHVKQLGDEWAESLRGTVRDNPLAAVATALALGVLYRPPDAALSARHGRAYPGSAGA